MRRDFYELFTDKKCQPSKDSEEGKKGYINRIKICKKVKEYGISSTRIYYDMVDVCTGKIIKENANLNFEGEDDSDETQSGECYEVKLEDDKTCINGLWFWV
jgi:hypothetical protein